jgi:hypothetical protein
MDKALMALAAAAAVAAAAAIGVAAAAFALFAWVSPWVGPAWAGVIVAGVAFLLVLIGGLLARGRGPSLPFRRQAEDLSEISLVQKAVEMAKERPLIAAAVALGAGVYVVRNPKLVAAVLAAFMEGRQSAK